MFTVMAERWTGKHRYIVGVFQNYALAVETIEKEYRDRAAKYNKFYLQTWDTWTGKEHENLLEIFEFDTPFGA